MPSPSLQNKILSLLLQSEMSLLLSQNKILLQLDVIIIIVKEDAIITTIIKRNITIITITKRNIKKVKNLFS